MAMQSSRVSGSGSLPLPTSLQASIPTAGSMIPKPYFFSLVRLSWVMGFSSMAVFIAGATSFLHRAARTVVVSMSSARPFANFAMTLAVAGAIRIRSAALAREMCFTSY